MVHLVLVRGGSFVKEEVLVELEVEVDCEVLLQWDGLCKASVLVFWHFAWQSKVFFDEFMMPFHLHSTHFVDEAHWGDPSF